MSGYLRNLINRASQRAPVLQRRQPALFEPVAPGSQTAIPMKDESDETGGAAALARPVTRVDYTPLPEPDAARPSDNLRGNVRRATSAQSTDMRPRVSAAAEILSETGSAAIEAGNSDAGSTRDHAARQNGHRTLEPLERRALTPAPAPANQPPIVDRNEVIPATRALVSQRPSNSAAVSPPTSSAVQEHRSDVNTRGLLTPPTRPITQAIQLARASPARSLQGKLGRTATGESVQISIGRVEIKAVTGKEQAKTPVAKARAPQLTLEDYLRERRSARP